MNQTGWDMLITGTVLGSIILFSWAKVSGMTIPELLREIREFFSGSSEELTTEAMVWDE